MRGKNLIMRKLLGCFIAVVLVLGYLPVPVKAASTTVIDHTSLYTPAAWPSSFIPYTDANGNIFTAQNGNYTPPDADITSGPTINGTNPPHGSQSSVYMMSDGANMFFRIRIGTNPVANGKFSGTFYMIPIGTFTRTANSWSSALVVGFDGNANGSYVYTSSTDGNTITKVYNVTASGSAANQNQGAEVVPVNDGTGQCFLDFQVPVSELTSNYTDTNGSSFTSATPIRLFYATSQASNLATINKDTMTGSQTVDYSSGETVTPADLSLQAPLNLTASAGDGQVSLNWTAVGGATSYKVYQSTNSGGPYTAITPINTTTNNSFSVTGLTNVIPYFFVVKASNAGGDSGNSNEANATPQAGALSAPTNLTATPGDSQVSLNWDSVTGATSYKVYQSTTSGGPYAAVTPVNTTTNTSLNVTGLTNGIPYYFMVKASNTGGDSGNSNEANATPTALTNAATPVLDTQKPADLTVNVGDNATLTVSASGGVSLSYQWYSNATGSNTGGTLISGATGLNYTAPTNTAGTIYYYCVVTNTDNSATGNKTASATSRAAKVTVKSLNNSNTAPIINTGVVTLPSMVKNTTSNGITVGSLLGQTVSDPDSGQSVGMAVYGADSGNGTWQYSLDGSTWGDFPSVTTSSALLLAPVDSIRFTPHTDFVGSASFTYRAWDQTSGSPGNTVSTAVYGGLSAFSSGTGTATVNVVPATLAINTSNPPAGTAGTAYSYTFTATGGTGADTYAVTAGSLPAGLTLATNGTLSGTPTASGTSTFTVTATDSGNPIQTSSHQFTLLVNPGSTNDHDNGGGGSNSSNGGSTNSNGPTITSKVVDKNTNQTIVPDAKATVTANPDGTDTVKVDPGAAILMKQPDGTQTPFQDYSKISYVAPPTAPVTVNSDGTVQVANLAKGNSYDIPVTYDLGGGQSITIGTMHISVDNSGNVSMTTDLIDPYGTLTDSLTGAVIPGAKVTLYYADTARNKLNGRVPGTAVQLPVIEGFKPNNNQNPQTTDSNGTYGFMVYSNTDYYVVVEKDGYDTFTSPTISVADKLVQFSIKLNHPLTGVIRIAGDSRVDTAIGLAKSEYAGKVKNIILATAGNYPDALTGTVLAYQQNAPILLVGDSQADQAKVIAYMKENGDPAGKVFVLGGTGVVTDGVVQEVKAAGFGNVIRLGGADRYETAVKIADYLNVVAGTPVVIASGENYPDALSVSSAAAINQYPILLVSPAGLAEAMKAELIKIKPGKVYVIGGSGAVNNALEDQIANLTSLDSNSMVRIGGADRYGTSVAVAKYFNLSGQSVCIATGNNFPDALAGSIYAANYNASVILAGDSLSDEEIAYLKGRKIMGATIFGGAGAVNNNIQQQLEQLVKQ